MQFHIEVGDVNIEHALVIEIAGVNAHAGFRLPLLAICDPHFDAHFAERSVAIIAK